MTASLEADTPHVDRVWRDNETAIAHLPSLRETDRNGKVDVGATLRVDQKFGHAYCQNRAPCKNQHGNRNQEDLRSANATTCQSRTPLSGHHRACPSTASKLAHRSCFKLSLPAGLTYDRVISAFHNALYLVRNKQPSVLCGADNR